ncbi:hypothetical protein EDD29_0103 [Actinocorallia herbida]|uniref:Uncharacterized protein n=1 Tax=Actinocorallia herbida TaxID=58109 RepID=A0A3N1CMT5_9ACTN|nr:hypothetical protein [Actinocorallia herbida]ROO82622.1 hypothetical protein EDD29_0103 [Actinocorallia herbida]
MTKPRRDPSGRVAVTLTFATDDPASMLQQDLLHRLDGFLPGLVGVSSFAFDETMEPEPDAAVYEVVAPIHGTDRAMMMGRFFDPQHAEDHARKVGGIVIPLHAVADYRPQPGGEVSV